MFDNPLGGPFGFGDPHGQESGANEAISEAQKILQGLLAELPEEAQRMVDKINREIGRIEEQTQEETAQIRERAEQQVAALESKAENRRKAMFQHAIEQMEPMQKELFRAGELGKALAIFVQIQALKAKVQNVLPDPGNLLRFQQIGKTHYFRVTGHNQGPVWGTDVYTADSHLATAAVHAGALEFAEEGVVKVTVVDMTGMAIRGTMRHGVVTMDWGPYQVGYRVTRV